MKKIETHQVWLAAFSLMSLLAIVWDVRGHAGTEFAGGSLTGPLLTMSEIGALLFLLAVGTSLAQDRVAAGMALAGTLLALPLYLFFLAPATFGSIFSFGYEFSIPPSHHRRWDAHIVLSVLTLALTVYGSVRVLASRRGIPEPRQS